MWPNISWSDDANALLEQITTAQVVARDLPLELARIHNAFEEVHPFLDGNGRAGRLALNFILVRLGFRPAIIFKRDRDKYLDALDQADNGYPGRLAEQLARSVIDNLHRFVVPNIAGPARIVPLRSLQDWDLSYEALRQAARRGRLEAHQAPTASGAPAAPPSSDTNRPTPTPLALAVPASRPASAIRPKP